MMDTLAVELVTFLKEASPLVWAAILRQVYVEAVAEIVWSIILLIGSFLAYRLARHGQAVLEESCHSDWDVGVPVVFVVAAMLGLGSLLKATYAAQAMANPEYAAIQRIITLLTGN